MSDQKKSIPLRIPHELWSDIKALAEQDLRSVNGQIEIMLREAVKARKRADQKSFRKAV